VPTGDVHTGVPSNQGIPEGAGQPIGTMPAEWDGIICISVGISNSHNAVGLANIKAQFEARAGFPNVIGSINCTHIAIKVPSHDEFVVVVSNLLFFAG